MYNQVPGAIKFQTCLHPAAVYVQVVTTQTARMHFTIKVRSWPSEERSYLSVYCVLPAAVQK